MFRQPPVVLLLNTLKSQVYISNFTYHKSIVSLFPQIEPNKCLNKKLLVTLEVIK